MIEQKIRYSKDVPVRTNGKEIIVPLYRIGIEPVDMLHFWEQFKDWKVGK